MNPLPLYPGAKACIHSGWCCRQGPCAFGTWDTEQHQCIHLTQDDHCGIYQEIMAKPVAEWKWNPAFGAGCCSSLNPARQAMLAKKLWTDLLRNWLGWNTRCTTSLTPRFKIRTRNGTLRSEIKWNIVFLIRFGGKSEKWLSFKSLGFIRMVFGTSRTGWPKMYSTNLNAGSSRGYSGITPKYECSPRK